MIKSVLIDIDNTLLDFNKCASWAIKTVLEEKGIEYSDRLFDVFKKVNDFLWRALEKGEISAEELYQTRFDRVFGAADIKLDGKQFEARFREQLFISSEKVVGAEEALEYLSSKYCVYAVSNAMQRQQESRLERSGLIKYLDGIFTSEKLGALKPDSRFFEECFICMDGKFLKNEVIIVGDSISADIRGGRDFGIKTCWFNYGAEKNDEDIYDFTVTDLRELSKFI